MRSVEQKIFGTSGGVKPGLLSIILLLAAALIGSMVVLKLSAFPLKWTVAIAGGLAGLIVLFQLEDPKPLLLGVLAMATLMYVDVDLMYNLPDTIFRHKTPHRLSLDLKDIILAVLYILWFWDWFKNRGTRITAKFVPLISFVLFIAWSALSILKCEPTFKLSGAFRIATYLRQAMLFWYLMNNVRDIKSIKALLLGAAVGISFHSITGLSQKILGYSINIPVLSPKTGGGLWENARIEGGFRHPNELAKLLSLYIPVFVFIGLFHKKDFKLRFFFLSVASAATLAVVFTLSRSGWGALFAAIAGGFFLIAYYRRKIGTFVLLSLLGMSLVMLPVLTTRNAISDRIFRTDLTYAGSAMSRIPQFKVALHYIADNPILGVGIGMYAPLLEKYDDSDAQFVRVMPVAVHDTYLYFAAENGLPALLFLLIFLTSIFLVGLKLSRDAPPPLNIIALGLSMGLFSNYISIGYTIYPFEQLWSIWVPIGIISAIYFNFKYKSDKLEDDSPSCP